MSYLYTKVFRVCTRVSIASGSYASIPYMCLPTPRNGVLRFSGVKGRVDQELGPKVGNVCDANRATDVLHERRHLVI